MSAEADTGRVLYLSHPQVAIDPAVPVPDWPLSALGRERVEKFAASPSLSGVQAIYSSAERKAVDTGSILAERLGLPLVTVEAMHENDRSATGYLPPERFEAVADRFFAEPETSVLGWERAVDAQARIRAAVARVAAASAGAGDVAVVAHGAVGALLLCALAGEAISRARDQPFQGHYWRARLPDLALVHGWRPIAPQV